ncbi:hypothetical protein BDV37DRAFT_279892 [Aspergillus pseudonomiae]|uniref:Uncharacterized protein n=1 Tax=Aspergillus pseudonomiae TaxID=1506151 RepID=A0A5N7DMS3_9EURO|nr:uncharacterized protein BDV37DRAFT_279892 [Aspergillus pseudonomiae]KAE8407359.1 hypothetical protein BDV37DRAFT_279892 [Aspergillus pseudonomiae]
MSLFISIHCTFELHLATPNSPAALVHTDSKTSPSVQNAMDIGGLPTLPCTLPGTSYGEPYVWILQQSTYEVAENPIQIDTFGDEECDSSLCPESPQQPGDSIDNAIDLDAATSAASNKNAIDNLPDRYRQTECAIDGRSLEEY